ncbi:MAG TPA: PRC-barrel domain-containing protein [Nitrosopumilaceae archaeon]|nr:PRC-barrel domain-containing protein [Nitrosopumilaceae archaeon]
MSAELRLKKLRGSGGYVMASVDDDQQRKGNLGGPDLFLAPVGRIDAEKISKYFCNNCEKDFEGCPRIDYENPNELVADNLMLIEKGQYICSNCGSVLAEYRSFSKPDESAEVGLAKPQTLASQILDESPPEYTSPQQTLSQPELISSEVTTFNSLTGLAVYDSEARRIGSVKQVGIQIGQQGIVLVVTKKDGSEAVIKWDEIKKVGEIVLLGSKESNSSSKCSGCGFENKSDAKFCESCGKKIK